MSVKEKIDGELVDYLVERLREFWPAHDYVADYFAMINEEQRNGPSAPFDWGVAPKEDHAAWRDVKEDWCIIRTSDGRYGWSLYNRAHEDVENTVSRGIEVAEGRACLFNRLKNMLMMRIEKYEKLPGNPRATRLRAVYHALRKYHYDMEKREVEKMTEKWPGVNRV